MTQNTAPQFLTPPQLAQRWGGAVALGTLANWRCQRVGPPFKKLRGRVVYSVAELIEWETKNQTETKQDGNKSL